MEKIFVSPAEINAAQPSLCPHVASAAGRLAANDERIAPNDDDAD
ncbi:hypothetical protein [Blastopirellula marina]|nr:hypothetical protein [Blastopirellula marina]